MNKVFFALLGWLVPLLAFASSNNPTGGPGLSFAPPPSDISVVFLGNIFGVVDGVLHGTGSQIMGAMFEVFNSAVLAIGGIVITYTLLVSTMNTAHEGQMLGQKWSSIWVPLRSTLGLALLIPKTSGYCLMQIFVMWIVVQGVGAADKVWAAALSYLNRGGVIVQAQMSPGVSLGSDSDAIAKGAAAILNGQVCMLGIQTVLENTRTNSLNSKQKNSGICAGSPSDNVQTFCNTAVPDFLGTVNATDYQNHNTSPYALPMPNFKDGPYKFLNGICGTINWVDYTGADNIQKSITSITASELQTAQSSRAIAIQQMYIDLSAVAQVMIGNDPYKLLNPPAASGDSSNNQTPAAPDVATQQFGVPYLTTGVACPGPTSPTAQPACVSWGQDTTLANNTSAPLFNGTEFQGAVADYNGIMLPTLNLVQQAQNASAANAARAFIQQANQYGWILAGSYFINLVKLNQGNTSANNSSNPSATNSNLVDTGSGLNESSFDENLPLTPFSNGSCVGTYATLCEWLDGDSSPIKAVIGLINGSTFLPSKEIIHSPPTVDPNTSGLVAISGPGSSTVNGFITNSILVNLPGQPGMTPPQFAMNFNMNIQVGQFNLPSQDFPCGKVKIMFFSFCLGELMGNIFYNLILKNIFNFFLNMMAQVVNVVVMTFLAAPLYGMANIFREGVAIIQQPTVNPVIALANMGVAYINYANELWITLVGLSVTTIMIPWFGIFVVALIMLVLPLIIAWLGVMVSIGFVTAYYIPMLPYMIFTFGSIAWLMVVIEAMVAAPIVALGVTHPEGNEAFGKGEHAIMILLNVFLRPAMMIIGYIAAISLSYVSVWIINSGFANALVFIQGATSGSGGVNWNYSYSGDAQSAYQQASNMSSMGTGYSGWAGIYGFFFSVLIYTTMYLIVVQKAFTLITYLPDKVLRWIGGQPESIGQEAAQWGEEAKKQVSEGGSATTKGSQQMDQQLGGYAQKGLSKLKGQSQPAPEAKASGGKRGSDGGDATPGPEGAAPE
ncbi:TPA: type IVB secretion system protein DotA [Legionella feeleii]